MIRNLSRDDYLLARGANPRTGLVTPGSHITNNSFDEAETLRATGIAVPAKWRQIGDEWISLEFGQPTPVPTPPTVDGTRQTQYLRTPKRIASGEQIDQRSQHTQPASRKIQNPITTTTGVPGTYAQTSFDANYNSFNRNAAHLIPRKPIHSPPNMGRMNTLPAGRPDVDIDVDLERSSSTPAVKRIPFAPADVGKHLPKMPTKDDPKIISNTVSLPPDNPFLGQQQMARSRDGQSSETFSNCGRIVFDKELPCLPMSNGPSQSPQALEQNSSLQMPIPQSQNGEIHAESRVLGPRDIKSNCPYVGSSRMRVPPQTELHRSHPRGGRPMPVPSYDGPSIRSVEDMQLEQTQDRGLRVMNRAHHRPNKMDDVFGVASIATTTNTTTFTDVDRRNQGNSSKTQQARLTTAGDPLMMNVPVISHRNQVPMTPTKKMSLSSADLTCVPMARTLPRTSARPQMLGRAEGMHSVPRLNPRTGLITMDAPLPWTTTGTPLRDNPKGDILPGQQLIRTHLTSKRVVGPGSSHITFERTVANQIEGRGRDQNTHNRKPGGIGPSWKAPYPITPELPPVQEGRQPPYHQHSQRSPGPGRSDGNIQFKHDTPNGLTRRCSRCHNGFAKDHQRSMDGVIPVSAKRQNPDRLDTVNESPCAHNAKSKIPPHRVLAPAKQAIDDLRILVTASPSKAFSQDARDHTICCPQCCKEQDCHEGCLGHPSPTKTPARSVRTSPDTSGSGTESQSSAKESDATSNGSDQVRVGRLALMRSAFKKSHKDKLSHSRKTSKDVVLVKKSFAELDNPSINSSSYPVRPRTFWGTSGSPTLAAAAAARKATRSKTNRSPVAAAEAAKAAIGLKKATLSSSEDVNPSLMPLKVKKNQRRKSEGETRNATASAAAVRTRLPTPNESRRVASGPTMPATACLRSASGKPRSASGTSVTTIDFPMPVLSSMGFSAMCEMILVPFEATGMWLKNHPGVAKLGWSVIERAWSMVQIMMVTAGRAWGVVFVYSKTGRLKLKEGDTAGEFVKDCVRSALYVLVFMAVAVAVMRVMKWAWDVVGFVGMVPSAILWCVKSLLGCGILW